MKLDKKWLIVFLLLLALIVRLIPIDFPKFTEEEARIASRGYFLARHQTDELGRKYPLIFNSLSDYQLPAVSYLTMIGTAVFGKTDLGVRIPFILIGTLLVFLTYKMAIFFSSKNNFGLISAFLIASSPTLIFLSKTPNEAIVLVFMFTLLFYLMVGCKKLWLIILTMIGVVLVSKFSWFILLPFLLFIGWRHLSLLGCGVLIVAASFTIFLTVPQAKRSFLENNFSIFSDVAIQNGINKLRGQGIESGWPSSIDRLLFNKSHFFIVGLLHWLSHFNPATFFGQFDSSGVRSFSYLGAWVKILIIPAVLGLFAIIRNGDRRNKLFLLFFLVLSFPAIFIYPNLSLELIVLMLPFMAIIITFGLMQLIQFNRKLTILAFFLIIFELAINIYNLVPEYKNTNMARPGWIQEVAGDIFRASKNKQAAVSDNIVSDVAPFINWYTPVSSSTEFSNIYWPYKFRQSDLSNIKIIGSNVKFRSCGKNEVLNLFISSRDLIKIQHEFDIRITNTYKDNLQQDQVFFISEGICLN